jgi:putative phosphoesterase
MDEHLVGSIADADGRIRRRALEALAGCSLVVHAGNLGRRAVLGTLGPIAPAFAMRGNTDKGHWGQKLPEAQVVDIGEVLAYVLHDLTELRLDPSASGLAAVVSGHTRRPAVAQRDGELFVDAGSAGPIRCGLPASVGLLRVDGDTVSTRLVKLAAGDKRNGARAAGH